MNTFEFDASLLEGNYVIGDKGQLHLSEGTIKENPFSLNVGECKAAQWFLDNENKAKHKIRQHMLKSGLGDVPVEDCFDYAIHYFIEKPEKEFKPNYFGEEATSTYTIDIYCIHQIQFIVNGYRNEHDKQLNSEVFLVEMDKDEGESVGKRCISYDAVNSARSDFDDLKEGFGTVDDVVEFDDLQDILDEELPYFNEEFRLLGFKGFDLRSFIYHMFLTDKDLMGGGKKVKDMDDNSLEEVANDMGITLSKLKGYTEMVQEVMKGGNEDLMGLPELIGRLIKGKHNGWVPQY